MRKTAFHILLGLVLNLSAVGIYGQPQSLSNLRDLQRAVSDTIFLDSLIIIPSSLRVTDAVSGQRIDTTAFRLSGQQLIWRGLPGLGPDSLRLRFRVLPYDLGRIMAHLDTSSIRRATADSLLLAYEYNPFAEQEKLFDFRGLDYNGTFARGISFGNNQDLVLNSSFNLQLAGELGEGIEILAAISDENIPLQAEGNTQQLQEFDKIFIQLKKGSNRLVAGDYELQRPNSYFMNYFKKLQGATFSNDSRLGKGNLSSNASIAIARGQFARNILQQQEGNQGPYKLQGNNGERFIIVLSGTEKVWFDGRLLQRGLEEDYIIDYNRGEVTFTNKRLITKDSRIVVEFEYSDQNYLRSMYALNTEYQTEDLRLYVNLFSQQDSRNSTGNQELTDEEKRILAEAGDDLSRAVVPGVSRQEEFNPLRAMYVAIDTLLPCGRIDTLLRYSTDTETARLTARFSFVGMGNGNYELDEQQTANERVYRWVAPDPVTCEARGSYAPVVQLIPPEQQMMVTTGAAYQFAPHSSIQTELALSNYDRNRFSDLDGSDNAGMALFSKFLHRFGLSSAENGWYLDTDLSYEYVHRHFTTLNPYRNPEFLRDWSIANKQGQGSKLPATEHLGHGRLTLAKPGLGQLEYGLGTFFRDSLYQGLRHETAIRLQQKGFEIDGRGSLLTSRGQEMETRFLRPAIDLSKTFAKLGNWQLGFHGEMEKNSRFTTAADTLSPGSYFYDLMRFYLRSPQQEKLALETNYTRRQDYEPVGERFRKNTVADEINLNGRWQLRAALRLAGNFTYRRLGIADSTLLIREPAETYLGRTDATINLYKGAVRSISTYEIGSGQEPKLEFTFIRVNKGEGTHIWLDSLYNNDGVVQPNEMEIAPFPDQADFVRVTTFTNEFIRTNYVNLNQSLQLNPKAVWFAADGIKKFLSRFSTQSSFKISRKTQDAPGVSPWNPFQLNIADSALVSVSSNVRNVLFFNRADPKYDFQVGMSDNSNKFVQTTGFESRRRAEQFFRTRWNLSRTFSTELSISRGDRYSNSESFPAKDYRITYHSLEPRLTFLPVRNFRAILRYKFQNDHNRLPEEGESARQHDINLEATYNRTTTTSIRGRASYVNINFSGDPNSPVGFAMLNGLAPGRNFLWELSIDRTIVRNVQLRISYEGRKTGSNRVVHVGRAQVAATF